MWSCRIPEGNKHVVSYIVPPIPDSTTHLKRFFYYVEVKGIPRMVMVQIAS